MFACVGLSLESLHGFKVRAYLDVANETRRLMWTLAHAHGALLSIVHVVFGVIMRVAPDAYARDRSVISRCLIGALILLPGGFFLGGVAFYAGDPGLGVLLVPVGAVSLIAALFFLARGAPASGDGVVVSARGAKGVRGVRPH